MNPDLRSAIKTGYHSFLIHLFIFFWNWNTFVNCVLYNAPYIGTFVYALQGYLLVRVYYGYKFVRIYLMISWVEDKHFADKGSSVNLYLRRHLWFWS